jgi:microsomal dipeptidase-like Zn-dependent dipeptidase
MNRFTIDLHCHPCMKPFGRSFDKNGNHGSNSKKDTQPSSAWHHDPPDGFDIPAQKIFGLTKFSQSDFATLAFGNVRLVCASMYSIERGFVSMEGIGDGALSDFFANLASSLGKHRLNFLQRNTDYFSDLVNEYKFYKELHNTIIPLYNTKRKYIMVRDFADLEEAIANNEGSGVQAIYVISTVEGLHNLNAGLDYSRPPEEKEVMDNLAAIKNWEYPPFYVTFAHHFYNQLCGHAQTMDSFPQTLLLNQRLGMNTGFTDLGWLVLKELLDNTRGRRVYIDIKHMSHTARWEYINFLKNHYPAEYKRKEFPLIVSHGACNGKMHARNPNPTPGLQATATRMYDADINFYDDEILEIARSGGILGLQLDERRIASKQYKQSLRVSGSINEKRHSNSKMIWNNIQHIVQLLDMNDMFAWDCIAIGTDNDGMIDPVDLFWTAENMDDLMQYIERHANNFFAAPARKLKNDFNRITPAEVVDRIFHFNAYEFFRKYFI